MPPLRELPGFRDYYLLEGGPDVLVSIQVFDSSDEALASNETWRPSMDCDEVESALGNHVQGCLDVVDRHQRRPPPLRRRC
jgi:hypothetical protein